MTAISKKVLNKINRACDSAFQDIIADISETYNIDKDELKTYSLKSKKRDKNGYTIFSSEKRMELKNEYPDKDFGEISKKVGEIWKELSQEEKEKYDITASELNHKYKKDEK